VFLKPNGIPGREGSRRRFQNVEDVHQTILSATGSDGTFFMPSAVLFQSGKADGIKRHAVATLTERPA
jgi:hypothetical protein